jgi:hypothetical protein
MTDAEYSRKLDELERLLNDPDVPMEPDRIWSLLADVSGRDQTDAFAASPVSVMLGAVASA